MRQAAERVGWAIGWVDRLLTAQAIIYLLPASAGHQKKWVHATFLAIIGSPPLSSSAALRQCPVSGRTVFRYFPFTIVAPPQGNLAGSSRESWQLRRHFLRSSRS